MSRLADPVRQEQDCDGCILCHGNRIIRRHYLRLDFRKVLLYARKFNFIYSQQ